MAREPESVVGNVKAGGCIVEKRSVGDLTVLSVAGTLDVLTVPELQARIAAVDPDACAGVIVDLSDVDFLGSSGMGMLVSAHADLAPAVKFVLVADGPATSRPLRLIGIADIIDVFPTLDEALTALNA